MRRVKNIRLRYSFFQKHFEVDFARMSDTLCNRATNFDKMILNVSAIHAFSTVRSSTFNSVGFELVELLEGITVLINFHNFLGLEFQSAMAEP